jgi:redox-sensing transcriptional repressor
VILVHAVQDEVVRRLHFPERRIAVPDLDRPAFASFFPFRGATGEGFPVVALFDLDPGHLAQSTAAVPVYPEAELEKRVPDLGAKIAVLALPTEKAQEMLNRLYDLGIRAIWSFSRADLHPPRDMAVVNWHLYDTLQILSYRISQMEEENPRG